MAGKLNQRSSKTNSTQLPIGVPLRDSNLVANEAILDRLFGKLKFANHSVAYKLIKHKEAMEYQKIILEIDNN